MKTENDNSRRSLLVAAFAACATYFCMYAFRKPFTAGTFEGHEWLGNALKPVLVTSQLFGYLLSKFIGIKVVSEMRREHRAATIVGLIAIAELALVGFAYAPMSLKVVLIFINGLPLGMVFGLVLAFLEGRRQTEALSAMLCASFIVSSGVVKSVGRWLVDTHGVSEFHMPMITGLIFFPPLLLAVWALGRTPDPDANDLSQRRERPPMTRAERNEFLRAYAPGLALLLFVYIALTVARTLRDDFAVEIFRDLGVSGKPEVFAMTETIVGICVTALVAVTIWIRSNLTALRATILVMCVGLVVVAGSAVVQPTGSTGPLLFMVACGIGLYVPYVAFHTSVFERIVAASTRPSNLGFLMYVADAVGYVGYAVLMLVKSRLDASSEILPLFRQILLIVAGTSVVALLLARVYFQRVLSPEVEAAGSTLDDDTSASASTSP